MGNKSLHCALHRIIPMSTFFSTISPDTDVAVFRTDPRVWLNHNIDFRKTITGRRFVSLITTGAQPNNRGKNGSYCVAQYLNIPLNIPQQVQP